MRSPLIATLFAALLLTWAPSASANGAFSHAHMSELAVEHLPEGPLRDLMTDPEIVPFYLAGSIFPDSGYAIGDGYGERAHWSPFHEAYLAYIKETWGSNLESLEARQRVAFLLGAMSHGLTDQIYDTTLLARALEVDGNRDGDFDRLADYFIITDERVDTDPPAIGPFEEISAVFAERRGYTVSAQTLADGMARMEAAVWFQKQLSWGQDYLLAWETYPWLGTHVYNPAATGSLHQLSQLVALYWQAVWRRLYDTDSLDADLVLSTLPLDPVNIPIDDSESEAYSRVGVVFGYGIQRSQLTPLLSLSDPAGEPVAFDLRTPYNGEIRNFIHIEPTVTLDYDTTYTLTLAPGVEDLSGATTTQPITLTFHTRCAPDRLEDCPPLAEPLVAGPIPTEVPPRPRPVSEPTEDTSPAEDTTSAEDTAADTTPAEDAAAEDAEADAPSPEPGDTTSGCGCDQLRARPASSSGIVLLLAMMALALRRRAAQRQGT